MAKLLRGHAATPNDCERSFGYFSAPTFKGSPLMQTLLLSGLFGAVCSMVLWIVGSASVKRDALMRRNGKLFPPEEI
jgi:hypothetical protein